MEKVGNQTLSLETLNLEDCGYSPEVAAQYDQLIQDALSIISSNPVTVESLLQAQYLFKEAQQLLKGNPSSIEETSQKIQEMMNPNV